jgi:hypothetical protein
MATAITKRADKGSALTITEMDTNLQNLVNAVDSKQATLVSGTNIKTVGGNSILGSGDITVGSAALTIVNTAVAYTVTAADLGKIINCTSGTFTVSLTAAATLGSGFTCTIWNTSATVADAITIDPNAAETIDGVATLILRRGEGLDIVCDGTNWQTSYKKTMRGYAENIVSTDLRPVASGRSAIAIGTASNSGSTASGNFSIAIGSNLSGNPAISSGTGSTAIGLDTSASSNYSAAIGDNSGGAGSRAVTGSGAMALGGSYASGTDSFAANTASNSSIYGATGASSMTIGYAAKSQSTYSVAIGCSANANNLYAVAVMGATATGQQSIAMGFNAAASGTCSMAIGQGSSGYGAVSVGTGSIAIGDSYASSTNTFSAIIADHTSTYGANGANGIAIGYHAKSGWQGIAIGYNSVSAGQQSIAIGYNANCSPSSYTGIALGTNSSVTGTGGVAISTDSGSGYTSLAAGEASVAIGSSAKSSQFGKYTFASRFFGANGDAQFGKIVLRAATTTTTAVVLTSNQAAASTDNQLIVATNQAMTFFGTLIAKQSASANMASYMFKGAIVNNGGTVSISSISVDTIVDTIGLGAVPTFTADNTNKGLAVTSGYKSATNIRWVCNIDSVEVINA